MAKKEILGSDIGRDAFKIKVNDNFTELYDKDVALEASINSLADKVIVESGINVNGTYIKFADGTQICYGRYIFTGAVADAVGSMYRSAIINIPSPAAFVGNNFNSAYSVGAGGYDAFITAFGAQGIGPGRTNIWRAIATTTDITVSIGFVYVGRWK